MALSTDSTVCRSPYLGCILLLALPTAQPYVHPLCIAHTTVLVQVFAASHWYAHSLVVVIMHSTIAIVIWMMCPHMQMSQLPLCMLWMPAVVLAVPSAFASTST